MPEKKTKCGDAYHTLSTFEAPLMSFGSRVNPPLMEEEPSPNHITSLR